jgi:hypothetical protein
VTTNHTILAVSNATIRDKRYQNGGLVNQAMPARPYRTRLEDLAMHLQKAPVGRWPGYACMQTRRHVDGHSSLRPGRVLVPLCTVYNTLYGVLHVEYGQTV